VDHKGQAKNIDHNCKKIIILKRIYTLKRIFTDIPNNKKLFKKCFTKSHIVGPSVAFMKIEI